MLAGSLVGLRAIELDDLEQLRIWRNRPENRRYFREYREISSSAQQEWYRKLLDERLHDMFAIVRCEDGQLLGAAGLCYIDWMRSSAEVSLYIGDGYIDAVYAPDALAVLLRYGFDDLSLRRLHTTVYEYDIHKRDLLLGANFLSEGVLRDAHCAEGRWYDVHLYGLLSYEFNGEREHGIRW